MEFVIFWDIIGLKYSYWTNIGYLSSYISENSDFSVNVKFYDINDVDRAVNNYASRGNIILGLSILQRNYNASVEFIQKIKKKNKDVVIIVGNVTATYYADKLMKHVEEIDYVVAGEGEETLLELLQLIKNNGEMSKCKGIYYRDNNQVIRTDYRPLIEDLEALPFPDRSFFDVKLPFFDIYASRGCDGTCKFCDVNTIFENCPGKKLRIRSIENVMKEIDELVEKRNCKAIDFMDSTFCSNSNIKDRLQQLNNALKERNYYLNLTINMRINQIDQETIDLLYQLSENGLTRVLLGVESFNDDDLTLYGKSINAKDIIDAYDLLEKNQLLGEESPVFIKGSVINFNPYTTIENLKNNMKYIHKYFPLSDIIFYTSRLKLFGSNRIISKILKDGLITENIDMPFANEYPYKFVNSNTEKVYQLLEYCYNEFKSIDYVNIFPFYKRYKAFNKDSIKYDDGYKFYWEYNRIVNDMSYHIFTEVIDIVEYNHDRKSLDNMIKEYNLELEKYKDKIDRYGKLLAVEYFK